MWSTASDAFIFLFLFPFAVGGNKWTSRRVAAKSLSHPNCIRKHTICTVRACTNACVQKTGERNHPLTPTITTRFLLSRQKVIHTSTPEMASADSDDPRFVECWPSCSEPHRDVFPKEHGEVLTQTKKSYQNAVQHINRLIKSDSISFQARFFPRIMGSDPERVDSCSLCAWMLPSFSPWRLPALTNASLWTLLLCIHHQTALQMLRSHAESSGHLGKQTWSSSWSHLQCYAELFSINRPGSPVHCEGHSNAPITQENRQDTHYIPSKGHPNRSWPNKRNLGVVAS